MSRVAVIPTRCALEAEIDRLHDLLLSLVATLDAFDGDADFEPEPLETDLGGFVYVTRSGLVFDDCELNDDWGR